MSRTREKLIEVARQLFAHKGVENTTMNDIAVASKKGRRTLYIYFKNKKGIYHAVIESELNKLHKSLLVVTESAMREDEKLLEFIYARLDAVKEVVTRNGTLRANFFRNIWRVESVRKDFDAIEIQLIKAILDSGVKNGVFEIRDTDVTAELLHYAFKGLEVPYIRGSLIGFAHGKEGSWNAVIELVCKGLLAKELRVEY
ncbi:MAG: TetR/AcrR family transcriptional regulator [Dysgonamonadaceae bacterium]|jgi:AcrR family transcriptional regulator|nr:TetR/AcrR family transcriptional regulator [Dysgonamonadaceae bacterium]